ncbi:14-3-3-like protein C [Lotus japonicus]|uniref:14-3-3-like protein C n=1 Tax=Lotus japonicus TaxID=34305 RepID=UPI0025848545|nr:14-3-3-like protein C [Lotus japonicus]
MASSKQQRENLVYIAKFTKQAERYEDMVDAMNNVVRMNVELTVEERDLFAYAYTNVVRKRRESRKILSLIEKKEESKGNDLNVNRIKESMKKLESELSTICTDIITLIDQHLLPQSSGESSVLYYRMKGDCYRYLGELKRGDERKEAVDQCLKAYQEASTIAKAELPAAPHIRAGVALNFSVFYYEILKSPERANYLAEQAIYEARSELVALDEDASKDSLAIFKLLRENIDLWEERGFSYN